MAGSAAHWPAVERWTPTYLTAAVGSREVAVRERSGPPRNIFQNLGDGGLVPFADYLDWVLATADDLRAAVGDVDRSDPVAITRLVGASPIEVSYYLDANLSLLSPTLLADVRAPTWLRTSPAVVNLWCGVLGTSSGLHCDVAPNCNVQVVGTKHFTLFPPSQGRQVGRIGQGTHCRFDPNAPDLDRHPDADGATAWECILRPGDALYLPVGWFHQVTVTSDWAVNVNFFWPRPFPQGLAVPALWRFLLRRAALRARSARRQAA